MLQCPKIEEEIFLEDWVAKRRYKLLMKLMLKNILYFFHYTFKWKMIWVLSQSHIIQPYKAWVLTSNLCTSSYSIKILVMTAWHRNFFFYTKLSYTKNTAKESKHIWNTWKMRIVMYLYSRLIAKPTGLSITALFIMSSICLSADQKWIDYF